MSARERGLLATIAILTLALAFQVAGRFWEPQELIPNRDIVPVAPLALAGELIRTGTIRTARAVSVAERRWGGTNCDAPIPITRQWVQPLSTVAYAEWDEVEGEDGYQNCRIVFNSRRTLSWQTYCAAMVHEYGHLSGFYEQGGPDDGAHSRNPHLVMYPSLTSLNVPVACRT